MARWLQVLSSYDMHIVHRPGKQHQNADGLSRIPCRQCNYDPDWEQKADNITSSCAANVIKSQDPCKSENKGIQEKTLSEKQKDDDDLGLVIGWVRQEEKPGYKSIGGRNKTVKSLWSQFETLSMQGNLLVRKTEKNMVQVIIPRDERRTVLNHAHDNRTAAHLGIRKTLAKIRQQFYWPGMQDDVKRYVTGCTLCAKSKNMTQTKKAPMQVTESGYPMERIAMDILCELPETDDGNRHILVISDYYTKWTESFPMRDMSAETVARILVEEVVCRFGVPSIIHSDQGSQFESALFQEMCHILQIEKTRTTPYHPQSDGMVERFNKTLVTMLRAFVNERHTDWDRHLPYVMMAYRSTEHETTSHSPNFMMLGRETSTPLDLQYSMPRNLKALPQNTWAWELQEKMEDAHQLVRGNVKGQMLRQKKLHDQKLSWQQFKAGDDVFVFFPNVKPGQSPKLACRWKGPFRVIAKLTDVTYRVRCGRKGKMQVIHVDRMKPKKTQRLRNEKAEDFAKVKEQQTQVNESCFESKQDLIGENVNSSFEESSSTLIPECETELKCEDECLKGTKTVPRQGRRHRKAPAKHSDYILF